MAATAVAALKNGKVVGIVVTSGGSGYAEVSLSPSTDAHATINRVFVAVSHVV